MERNYEIIAVDFDGTLCFSKWPDCGEPNLDLQLKVTTDLHIKLTI